MRAKRNHETYQEIYRFRISNRSKWKLQEVKIAPEVLLTSGLMSKHFSEVLQSTKHQPQQNVSTFRTLLDNHV